MKSKIFIGSSVEGLNVGYAIQSNLTYDSEVTIWSQGVFEPSKSTLESLIEVVERMDFAIFIFTPDDVIKMRGENKNTVRDNVIFELGLFIGAIGKERTYIVFPRGSDLHIPTDLLGINMLNYENDREDGNLEAATGLASNEVRKMIKKIGNIIRDNQEDISSLKSDSNASNDSNDKKEWFDDFVNGEYDKVISNLSKKIDDSKEDDEKFLYKCWQLYSEFKKNKKLGLEKFEKLKESSGKKVQIDEFIINILFWEEFYDECLNRIRETGIENEFNINITADCIRKTQGLKKTIEFLETKQKSWSLENYLKYIDLLEETEEENEKVHTLLKKIYKENPSNKIVLEKYAKFADEKLDNKKIALFFWDKLLNIEEANTSFLVSKGNCCLSLGLNGIAEELYFKAKEIDNEKAGWILANLGNLYKNQGFFRLAKEYLKKAIDKNSTDEYSHDRYSRSIILENDERKKMKAIMEEGRMEIYEIIEPL